MLSQGVSVQAKDIYNGNITILLIGHYLAVDPKVTSLSQSLMGVEVTGSTLGIIGMGDIGYKIAQRCKGFDMKILYHNRNRR